MSVSWYDLLDVSPDAGQDEIRVAWKSAIADLDPTDRRFRLCNEAAEVLLDPQQRAAYDAELAAATTPAAPVPDSEETPREAAPEAVASDRSAATRAVPNVPGWLLLALALALVGVLGVAGWKADDKGLLPWMENDVESAISEARQAAAREVPEALSYDYTKLQESRERALAVLTGDQRSEFEKFWDDSIAPNLAKRKATNKAEVLSTGVVRASDDGKRVELVTVVQAEFSNADTTGRQTLTITIRMVDEGGEWLIEDIEGGDPENPAE